MVLQRERHAVITGKSSSFEDGLAAPAPCLLVCGLLVLSLPNSLRDFIAAATSM